MNDAKQKAPVRQWLVEPPPREVRQSLDRLASTEDVRHVAVMPDVHLSREVCVGAVVATSRLLLPQAVGGDIGCGMAVIAWDAEADVLDDERAAALTLRALYRRVPANRHSAGRIPEHLPDDLRATPLSAVSLQKRAARDGRVQLGTLGRGNHFLEFQADDANRLWLLVHSGSRVLGQAITARHLALAKTTATGLAYLDAETSAGRDYLRDVEWALRYAAHNRRAMVRATVNLMAELFGLAAVEDSLFDVHHNHVRRERHFGEPLWVHRKGAQSARPGERGVVPGSMGTASFHVEGEGCEAALQSCSHGAGRQLSRSEARRKISPRQLGRQMETVWFDQRRANALCEEAPAAYKDVYAVMRAQRELVRKVRTLRPLLCYKGA